MRRLSGEFFASRTRLSVYIDRLAKIDTQLYTEVKVEHTELKVEHTELKVEEIFKVISPKHE
jgi:hypothetical protein